MLIAIGVLLFIAISGQLARFLTTENLEREDDLTLLKLQASGAWRAMLHTLDGCQSSSTCIANVKANAMSLRRKGSVKILELNSGTSYSLTGSTGKSRVAWAVIGQLPVVQCIDVKRTGNALTGISVKLESISRPIKKTATC